MEVLLVVALEVVKILRQLGETPYEPLKEGTKGIHEWKRLNS
jgi:hypothetical protein